MRSPWLGGSFVGLAAIRRGEFSSCRVCPSHTTAPVCLGHVCSSREQSCDLRSLLQGLLALSKVLLTEETAVKGMHAEDDPKRTRTEAHVLSTDLVHIALWRALSLSFLAATGAEQILPAGADVMTTVPLSFSLDSHESFSRLLQAVVTSLLFVRGDTVLERLQSSGSSNDRRLSKFPVQLGSTCFHWLVCAAVCLYMQTFRRRWLTIVAPSSQIACCLRRSAVVAAGAFAQFVTASAFEDAVLKQMHEVSLRLGGLEILFKLVCAVFRRTRPKTPAGRSLTVLVTYSG